MSLSSPFISRPVATSLLAVAIAVMGAIAYYLLAVAPLPQVSFPMISVRASLSGASPENMASSVATPLERSLGNISGLMSMSSTNTEGSTRIFLQFDLDKNVDDAAREVQAAINAAQPLLPSSMRTPPTYRKVNPSSSPIMALALTSDTLDQGQLYDLASTILAQKLAQVEGIGEVTIGGSSLPAVRVDLNPYVLSSYGIALDEVRSAITSANTVKPNGFLENAEYRWQIGTNGQLSKAKDFEDLVIRWQDGAAVRLKDVAKVYDSIESVFNSGFYNNEKAILMLLRRQESANIIKTVDLVKAELPALRLLLPSQVDLDIVQDRTPSIRATLAEAEFTLIMSVVLVTLVVLVFLQNVRATLIPAVSVPLSLLGTFIVMYFLEYSLNTISLMALIVATGFVVDDSIVVLENITRHLERGVRPFTAALQGAKEVGFTVMTMSVSLIAVFIPLFLMGGLPGRLFREFAVTLSVAILMSLLVSLTLTPMMCAQWLKNKPVVRKERWLTRHWNRSFDAMLDFYKKTLGWALRFRFLTLLMLLLTIGMNVYLYVIVPKGFFPQQDTGMILGFFRVDQGTSFQAMVPKLETYRQEILKDPNVDTVMGYAGGRGGSNSSFLMIQLKPFEQRELSANEVINRLRSKFSTVPGAQLSLVPQQDIRMGGPGGGSTGSYDYTLMSGDLELLREWVPKVQRAMVALPELTEVNAAVEDKGRRIELVIDREMATRLGVDMSLIAGSLNNLFSQRQVSVIYSELNQYHVVMGVEQQYAQDAQVLETIELMTADGSRVPLSAFATFETANAPLSVRHQGLLASDSIAFNLAPGVTLEQASNAIENAVERLNLPTNEIQAGFEGNAQMFQQSTSQQPLLILAALVVMYIVLGILYESYMHPLTILSTLPSAGVGALLALMMVGMEFTLIALIGVFLLIGIVKKNAIIMVDFALQKERQENCPPEQAIYEACVVRFRPIMMTTLAAMFGALPLVLATGAGVEMRQPLGVAIVGGLFLSQVLTLYTTPVVYLYLDKLRWRFARKKKRTGEVLPGTESERLKNESSIEQ
ncbi:efflux RND transporter permease subunit [Advenella sp. RU8]|mgnify:CR=1 FL=1|uniref:efflux RND transporter permease subunit n=1 Tax=Advenella sp. RU8 TaxID=3399575 RepID=UPI003AACC3E6